MKRFFGMMPSSEVKMKKQFRVGAGQLKVTIEAGENGWTILYADSSSEFNDVVDTTENNFNKALSVLETHFGNINQI